MASEIRVMGDPFASGASGFPYGAVVVTSTVGSAFVPTNLSGCVLWLRADKGITLNNTTVSAWQDQSSDGLSFTQGTQAQQPTYASGSGPQASQNAVQFVSASATYLSGSASPLSAASPWTVFSVQKFSTLTGFQTVYSVGDGTSGFAADFNYNSDANRSFTISGVGNTSDGAATSSWEVWTLQATAANVVTMRVNYAGVSLPTSGSIVAPANQMLLGAYPPPTNLFNGYMWEMIAYNRALSPSEITQVENYIHSVTGI